jgi:hypothetical protein
MIFFIFLVVAGRIRIRIRIRDVLKLTEYTDPEHYSTIAVFFPFQIPDPKLHKIIFVFLTQN